MVACNFCGSKRNRALFAAKGYHLVRCNDCDLAYIANPPSLDMLARIYSVEDGTYHAELLDEGSHETRRMRAVAGEHMDFVARCGLDGGLLLDVGCSVGHFLKEARAAGFQARGIEFCDGTAAHATRVTGLPVERGTIHDSALEPASCDMVTMFDVIEHVPDPTSDILAAWNLLKPGGWLVLSTPNIDGLFPRASRPLARPLGYWPHPEPPHHLYQFSVATLSGRLQEIGFEIALVSHRHIDLAYTFGSLRDLIRMPKRLAYALVFAPLSRLGPLLRQGDWFYLAARKPAA